MTLVTVFGNNLDLYIVGDIMISNDRAWFPLDVPYPTAPKNYTHPNTAVTGLAQKIVKITPNIFLVWAGNSDEIIPLLCHIRKKAKKYRVTRNKIKSAMDYFINNPRNKTMSLQVALIFNEPEEWGIYEKNCLA